MNAFLQELFHGGIYKRTQGRITRQLTWLAIAVLVAFGLWRLQIVLSISSWQWAQSLNRYGFHYVLPGVLLMAGLWIAYRAVNFPAFADFLIAVEAEMNKVSWPSRGELFRASIVVLFTIFFLAATLYGFDLFWRWFFYSFIRIAPPGETPQQDLYGFALSWRVWLGVWMPSVF